MLGSLAYQPANNDVIEPLLAVPAGAIALAILALDELYQAFVNMYSTAISLQTAAPRTDRRWLAAGVGAVATVLGLIVTNGYASEGFLLLIGALVTPLGAVVVIDHFWIRSGTYDVGEAAPARLRMLVPWAAGFVASF